MRCCSRKGGKRLEAGGKMSNVKVQNLNAKGERLRLRLRLRRRSRLEGWGKKVKAQISNVKKTNNESRNTSTSTKLTDTRMNVKVQKKEFLENRKNEREFGQQARKH
jgi:hypothetical protein